MSDPVLTAARRAVWSAIENWPPLAGEFQRVWKFEDVVAMQTEPSPSIGDLPALAIYPAGPSATEWQLNQSQRIPYTLDVQLWTRHWSLPAGERLWQEIGRALFQSRPPGQPTYILDGTGYNGVDLGPLTAKRIRLGKDGPPCTLWHWTIGLRVNWNPAV